MTRREWIDHCLTYADAYEDYPFDAVSDGEAWTVMRHKSNRKSFALIYERDGLCINLKCEPMQADFWRRVYPQVTPGYHMNKSHWNTVRPNDGLDDQIIRDMIDHSFALTAPKGRKKQ